MPPARNKSLWPVAFAAVAVTLIIVMGILANRLISEPVRLIEDGIRYVGSGIVEVYRDGKKLVKKISAPEMSRRFESYLARGQQVQEMVVYRSERLEYDELNLARGVSTARVAFLAPVEYTYYVDMSKKWEMSFENGLLKAVAPPLQCQRPNIRWERRKEFIDSGYLIFDEEGYLQQLKDRFPVTADSLATSPSYYTDARKQARESIAHFLNNWISSELKDEYEVLGIAIRFEDEAEFSEIYPSQSNSYIGIIREKK